MKDITDTLNDVCMVLQCNIIHDAVTVAMLPNGLQLHPRVLACPLQIRDHHYIDVYTDINWATATWSITIAFWRGEVGGGDSGVTDYLI